MKDFLKRHKQILLILAITIAFRLLVGLLTNSYILMQNDSNTYSNFTENIFLGQVNVQRTPLYPLFIIFVRLISFSPNGYLPIVIAQEIVSLISLVFMYKIIARYTKSNKMIYIFTLIYAFEPTIWHWNKCILTESLSISLGVIFAWLLIRHIDKPKIWSAITIAIGSFLLIMLRPSFLALFAIIIGFWIVRFIISKIDRKQSVIGFGVSLACMLLLFGYMHLNYLQNGWNSITNVDTANQIMNLIEGDIYQNPKYQDIVNSFTENPLWSDRENTAFVLGWIPISNEEFGFNFSPEYVRNYVKDSIKLHFEDYVKYTGEKFIISFFSPVASIIPFSLDRSIDNFNYATYETWANGMIMHWNILTISFLTYLLFFPLFFVYIYIFWVIIYAIVKWAKGKLDWIDLGFGLIIFAQLATIVINAPPQNYDRLFQPALPFLFVLVYKHISEGRFDWAQMKWANKLFKTSSQDTKI